MTANSIPDTRTQQTRGQLLERSLSNWRDELDGRVAVVTGGARGIGKVMADWLVRAGVKVVALDRTWRGADAHKQGLESAQGLAIEADITKDSDLDNAYDHVVDRYGGVDILVNNAALVSETLFPPMGHRLTLDTTDDDWAAMFGVNVFGTVKVTRRFIKPMQENGRGSIVNVVSSGILSQSSGGGYYATRPYTAEMPYQAAKAAVTTFGFYLAEEVRADGVAVNSFMPGHTRASWFDHTAHAYGQAGQVYFQRPVVSEHVVPITLFLAAQDGQHVTGRLYHVPDWNYDSGYGDYAFWQDHDLPPEMEQMYTALEAATPAFGRTGVPQLPFDAQIALFVSAMGNMARDEAGE
ncbi:SDR family NAD(P)-dependent oxidoreductase [Mycolicibacterium frederiksbergense]|uniref:SDR family oxidoreductase n=1 Tax=Mycolicibacterium frederiksbergense TaxID=117567 RepID=A0A6H0S1Q8_9MYCO|nr:SDR family oxidoreductase [Mycolicibacterium frederiksbergense]QIV79967.1 SDR family oxidoreductase [Mycolicibacterium frederiksbergense]